MATDRQRQLESLRLDHDLRPARHSRLTWMLLGLGWPGRGAFPGLAPPGRVAAMTTTVRRQRHVRSDGKGGS